MALVVPDVGEVKLLKVALGVDPQEDLLLKLFSNDLTPDDETVLADFTECAGSAYAAKTLAMASWAVALPVVPGDPSEASYALQTYTLTGALTAYGYYLVGATSGALYWAERFTDGPYIIPAGGGTIDVTPKFTGQ